MKSRKFWRDSELDIWAEFELDSLLLDKIRPNSELDQT